MNGSLAIGTADVGLRLQRALRRILAWLAIGLTLLALFLLVQHPDRLGAYLAVAVPLLLSLALWQQHTWGALPILPLYLSVQALVYAGPLFVPVLVADSTMTAITSAHLDACTLDLLCWFLALPLGWWLTPARLGIQPLARPLSDALDRAGPWPARLSLLTAAMSLLLATGFYWQLAGPLANGLLSPYRTAQSMLLLVASFSGAYVWGRGRLAQPWLWLGGMLVVLWQGLGSLLLSAIQLQILTILAGLWLAGARTLLPVTLVLMFSLSFLNQGKHELRARYWATGSTPGNPVQLIQEWVEASLNPREETAGLFTARLNSLGNLAFLENALMQGYPTLNGESFAVIPQVLMPRLLNQDKVRSHEGQVLLNLHFGRQRTREDTEKAYIAWGLLTESIGNFGRVIGPWLVGLITGALIRISETVGRQQPLLSTPGLASLFLLFAWMTAYESAASTFTAMVVQNLTVILVGGWYLSRQQRRLAR